jgi:hypothetical protein
MENPKFEPQKLLFQKMRSCVESNGLKIEREYIIENKKGCFQIFKHAIFNKSKPVIVFMHSNNEEEQLQSFEFDDHYSKKVRDLIEYYDYLANKEQIDSENVKINEYLNEL